MKRKTPDFSDMRSMKIGLPKASKETKTSYAKGMWFYEFNPLSSVSPNGQFTIKAGEIGLPIAMLPLPIGGINTYEKQEANAKLISAAPKLLDLLKRFVEITGDFNDMQLEEKYTDAALTYGDAKELIESLTI